MDSVNLPSLRDGRPAYRANFPAHPLGLLAALTVWAFLVHGYHPFAEDGGVYAAGIEKLLNPALFPAFTAFTTEHLRFSLFAPLVAMLSRGTHLPLEWTLLLLYLFSLFTTLLAGWTLVSHITPSPEARAGAVVLLASALTVPVAGTSLILSDPYLTARSLSTPLVLFALAFTVSLFRAPDRRSKHRALAATIVCLIVAACFHPLMAVYGLAAALLLAAAYLPSARRRWQSFGLLLLLAILLALILQTTAAPDTAAYDEVASTRYYWFPLRWQWYELLGLLGPLIVLALCLRSRDPRTAALARAAVMLGLLATSVAALFCRAHLASHLVARLQPLRCFSTVYLVMLLLLGAWLGERWLKHIASRWLLLTLTLGALMFFVQRSTFPASAHLELPGRPSPNPWVQAFRWIAQNTPEDAVFALDAHYITTPGEDAQCFRAISRRSALPDYSKDGGEASITPALTPAWVAGVRAQTALDRDTDAQRYAAVARLGAGWIVLRTASPTRFPCPYANATVKACRLAPR